MPTPAQIKAGNYAMKHVRVAGLDISIENRKGSRRSGKSGDGKEWSVIMPCDYGYIKRTTGADGDSLDVMVGPNKDSQYVVVVNQHGAVADAFDEVKIFVGFHNLRQVKSIYGQCYTGDMLPRPIFKVTTIDKLKEWIKSGRTWGRFEFEGEAGINLIQLGSALRERVQIEHHKSPALEQHDVVMKMKGEQIGHMRVHRGAVDLVTIRDEFRGMGLGKKLYGEAIKAQPGRTLRSDSIRSDADERVWQSLMKRPASYKIKSTDIAPRTWRGTTRSNVYTATMKKFDAQPEKEKPRSRLLPFLAGAAAGGLTIAALRRKPAAPEFFKPTGVTHPSAPAPTVTAPPAPVRDINLAPVVKSATAPAPAAPAIQPSKRDMRIINARPTTERGKLSQRKVLANHLHALRQAAKRQREARPLKDQIFKGQTHDNTKRYRETGLTGFQAVVNTYEFRRREQEQEKPSALRRVISVLAPAAIIGGTLAYKHYNRPKVPTPALNPSNPAHAAKAGIEVHHPVTDVMATDVPRSTRWLTPAMKGGTAPMGKNSLFHKAATSAQNAAVAVTPSAPAPVAPVVQMPGAALVKPKTKAKKTVKKTVKSTNLAAILRTTEFNDTNDAVGHLYGASDRLMTAYRKGRRVVPWIKRGTQVAEDSADIASGKKVKDPFYKKSWFKSAAVGAAIATPIFTARKINAAHHQDRLYPNTLRTVHPITGGVQEHALKIARKIDSELKKPIFTGDRPFFAAKTAAVELEYDSRGDWDLRDPRGKSARVFAPGSKRRERREKHPSERVDNIRLVRNIAIGASVAGLAGTLHYRNRLNKLTGKPSDLENLTKAGKAIMFPRKPVAMSANLRTIGFGRKDPAIHRVIDATRNNVHAPELPEAPAPIRLVLENKNARSALLRGLLATTAVGGGVLAGQHLKRPKTGAALGGIAAGAILNH